MSDIEFKEGSSNDAELSEEQKRALVDSAETPEDLRAILKKLGIILGEDGQEHTGEEQAEKLRQVMEFMIHPSVLVETYGIRAKAIRFLEERHQKAEKH
jgi:hypothetical protein